MRYFSLALLALSLLLNSQSSQAQSTDPLNTARISKLADEFLRSYNEDFDSYKLDAWMEHWADDAVRESSRERWEGKKAIRHAYEDILRGTSENRLTHEKARLIVGNRIAWQGDYAGRSRQTGRPMQLPIAIFLTFNDAGKVVHAQYYLDIDHLNDQRQGKAPIR
jgi:ketosteroid isomerase-like protein